MRIEGINNIVYTSNIFILVLNILITDSFLILIFNL